MAKSKGRLSPAQYEILQAIWDVGAPGATRMQIWERISQNRKVVRTTIVNLVDRLEARGWLKRIEQEGSLLFWPTAARDHVEADMAEDFVKSFFGGSASHLVMSLLGRQQITPEEVERLREVYNEAVAKRAKKRGDEPKRKKS
ncbi:MAG: BlaI/MecI/CopY family transcriptional regulator [Pirellulales bacterium]